MHVIQLNTKIGVRVLLETRKALGNDTDTSDLEEDPEFSDVDGADHAPFETYFLAEDFAAGCPKAIKKVKEKLTSANLSMDSVMAYSLASKITDIELIDRMAMQAEKRRNDALREIERQRATFGKALRSVSDNVLDAEFEPVQAPQIENKEAA